MSEGRFYLTTPLYYVNAKPHLGHAYTTIVADCLARASRQRGKEVFLLTGTDEHGEKVAQAARENGLEPQAFVDQTSELFKGLWARLGISYDHFIRTTDPAHRSTVQEALRRLEKQGALQRGTYTFWYCLPCETSWAAGDFPHPTQKVCPTCKRAVEEVTEEDFFLNLEAHRPWLKRHILEHPDFIQPQGRCNEVLALLEEPLPQLCITRPQERVSWGIEVPFSPAHVTYVWFDALLNYITALGWPEGKRFQELWVETGAIHLVGKDILRHHALYWPIILHALGVALPKKIFAHGWWLIKGEKMSKSKGNIVDPRDVVEAYGLDGFRYFLLREVPFGEDGIFSEEALRGRINADLANDLGNLVYRTLTMLEKHTQGGVPPGKLDPAVKAEISECQKKVSEGLERLAPNEALRALWVLINKSNLRIERSQPWTLAREGKRQALEELLYGLAEVLRALALLLWPFLPTTAESILKQLGLTTSLRDERLPDSLEKPIPPGTAIAKGQPLFPRLEP